VLSLTVNNLHAIDFSGAVLLGSGVALTMTRTRVKIEAISQAS
jgi:hypothetical protein